MITATHKAKKRGRGFVFIGLDREESRSQPNSIKMVISKMEIVLKGPKKNHILVGIATIRTKKIIKPRFIKFCVAIIKINVEYEFY